MKLNFTNQYIKLLLLLIILSGFVACSNNGDSDGKSPQAAVNNSVSLLEKQDYKGFVDKYLHPSDLKYIYKKFSREKFIKQFEVKGSVRMLNALKSIRNTKPHYTFNKKAATYTITPGKRKMVLVKHKENWYIINTENPQPYLK